MRRLPGQRRRSRGVRGPLGKAEDADVFLASNDLKQAIVAQLTGVIVILVAGHDAVQPRDDELGQVVEEYVQPGLIRGSVD